MKSWMYFHHPRKRTIGHLQIHVKRHRVLQTTDKLLNFKSHPLYSLVPGGRVELPLSCENRILSPARLPVPPSGQKV